MLLRDRLPPTSLGINTWPIKNASSRIERCARRKGRPSAATRCCRVWSSAASAVITCRRATRPVSDLRYYCNEYWRSDLQECCGRIAAATLDDLVVKELLRALEPAALELSLRAIENVEQERKRLHDQWRQKLERVQHEVGRAERQYHAVEPENRLVARTLEARWEEALKKQRQAEEEYHRFLANCRRRSAPADRERIQALSQNVSSLWNAAGTSAVDRKQIVRCVVERVVVAADKATELHDVTIVWQGGLTTQHQVARPVGSYEQLKDYQRLTERLKRTSSARTAPWAHRREAQRRGLRPTSPPRRLHRIRGRRLDAGTGLGRRTIFATTCSKKTSGGFPTWLASSASSHRRSITGSNRDGSIPAARPREST